MTEEGARMASAALPMMEALEGTVDGVTSFSMTGLLQDVHKQPFVDDFHYSADVADALAATITAIIARDRRLLAD